MKVELKNLKVHQDMSEETTCFSATIYIDGKKAGNAENSGKGACTMIWLEPEYKKPFADYIASLPKKEVSEFPTNLQKYFPDGLVQDEESFLDDLVHSTYENAWVKRHIKKKTIFRKKGVDAWSYVSVVFGPVIKAQMIQKYGADIEFANER